MRCNNSTIPGHQTGVGLIEVLVSLFVLAIAVLGFAALQTQSVATTSESMVRTSALNIMRNLGDDIRSNPSAIADYSAQINSFNTDFNDTSSPVPSTPTNNCGFVSTSTTISCNPAQQATADSYKSVQKAFDDGFQLRMDFCPGLGGNDPSSVMRSYCLITSWNQTNATFGADADPTDGSMDCMAQSGTRQGLYHRRADCMIMELF